MRGSGFLLMVLAAAWAGEDELPKAIRTGLLDKDPTMRAATVRRLARFETDVAAAALTKSLHDPAANVRQEAAVALARRKPDPSLVPHLRDALGAKDWWLRWRATLALSALGPKAAHALPELIKALDDETPEVSGTAARALAKVAPSNYGVVNGVVDALVNDKKKRDIPALLLALRAAKVPLPKRAAMWLGRAAVTGKTARGRAARAFLRGTPDARRRAWFKAVYSKELEARAEAIRTCAERVFRPYVIPLLADPDVCANVLWQIWANPGLSKGCVPLVVPCLASDYHDTREAAKQVLDKLDAKILLRCIKLSKDTDGWKAAFAAPSTASRDRAELLRVLADRAVLDAVAKLVKIDPGELLDQVLAGRDELPEALRTTLMTGDTPTRAKAVRKLARIETEAATEWLTSLLDDSVPVVRQEAAVALAKRKPHNETLVPYLRAALGNKDWWLRWRAALALRPLGNKATPAVPELVDALDDADAEVASAAVRALMRIAPRNYHVVTGLVDVLVDDKATRDVPAVLAALRASGAPLPDKAAMWLGRHAVTKKTAYGRAARAFLRGTPDMWLRIWFSNVYGDDARARDEAIRSCRHRVLRPYVVPLLADADVRVSVLWTIGHNKEWSKDLVPVVIPYVADENKDTRAAANATLDKLGAAILVKCIGRVRDKNGWHAALAIPPRESPDRATLLRALVDRPVLEAVAKLVKIDPGELLDKFAR